MNTLCWVPRFRFLLAFTCLFGLISGCKTEEFVDTREKVLVVPVTGKILFDGKPLEIPKVARIIMHPDEETLGKKPKDVRVPSAWSEPDGTSFKIGTYASDDGAPVGKYKLTIEVGTRSMLNGNFKGGLSSEKYADPAASQIEIEIKGDEGSIDLQTIEVTSN